MWLFTIIALAIIKDAISLKLVSLEVPNKVARGEDATLKCHYALEDEELYSIKWYKDDIEFFRYVPIDRPQRRSFTLQGVNVDLSRSNDGSIYLTDISDLTAGRYRCEVSASAPSFQTLSAEKTLAVVENSGEAQYETDQKNFGRVRSGATDRTTMNMLLVTMFLILKWRYHV